MLATQAGQLSRNSGSSGNRHSCGGSSRRVCRESCFERWLRHAGQSNSTNSGYLRRLVVAGLSVVGYAKKWLDFPMVSSFMISIKAATNRRHISNGYIDAATVFLLPQNCPCCSHVHRNPVNWWRISGCDAHMVVHFRMGSPSTCSPSAHCGKVTCPHLPVAHNRRNESRPHMSEG